MKYTFPLSFYQRLGHLLLFTIFLLVGSSLSSWAQSKHTVSGYIKDASNGEELIGASLYISELSTGGVSNEYGFYSLTLPEGKYTAIYSYVGFVADTIVLDLTSDKRIDVELGTAQDVLNEIVIKGKAANENVTSTEMSTIRLNVKDIKAVPVLFGEQDILKTIQLLPGVQSAGEGNSGFYVRGGGVDQNLILLDEAPVYNASHLLGFFSVFNSDAIKDVKLIKGGIPAEYGGRLSSVLDVKMKDGNSKRWSVSGGLGLIASRLTVEGPLIKDKASLVISGRRTYADTFLKLSKDSTINSNTLYFYDFNVKTNYHINDKNRLFLSGYFGRDVFKFQDVFGFDWGNTTGTVRWNHLFNDRFFLNSSFVYSNYDYAINIGLGAIDAKISSGIQDFNIKEDFQYFIAPNNVLKFGLNGIYHTFIPGTVAITSDGITDTESVTERYGIEGAAFVAHEVKFGGNWAINYGLRLSNFTVLGADDWNYQYDDEGNRSDSTYYAKNEVVKSYNGLEPRLALTYTLNPASSLKASYNRTYQYVQLLSSSSGTNPTDIWLPSSALIKPQLADQVSMGYFRNFFDNQFETSVEVYYKTLQNQIDYRNGADLLFNPDVESQLVFGEGFAYGAEFHLKKGAGKLNGWLSYTLATSKRRFDAIDAGEVFPAKQDRRHDVSLVAIYEVLPKLTLSSTWVYNTGDAVTFPQGKYEIDGNTAVPYYPKRNRNRYPDYHRLDFSATWFFKQTTEKESSLNLSVYNVYSRLNAYLISFAQSEADPNITEATKISLFPVVPSLTWNFKF